MNAERDRDRLLEDALKHELRAAGAPAATDACLDAETVAAWMEGGLDTHGIALAEAHAANCARCQALLGSVARTLPVPVAAPHGARVWRWWFAPLAATAAAATVWMVVPPQPAVAPAIAPAVATPPVAQAAANSEPAPAAAPPAGNRQLSRERVDTPRSQADARAQKSSAPAFGAPEQRKEEAKLADAAAGGRVAAAPPPAVAQRAQAAEASEAIKADVTARSSPSPEVIWTVGRAGLVRLATDGRTFVRVPFPEAVDLTAVTATDDRQATVTAADGRTFQTADGGRTWTRP